MMFRKLGCISLAKCLQFLLGFGWVDADRNNLEISPQPDLIDFLDRLGQSVQLGNAQTGTV